MGILDNGRPVELKGLTSQRPTSQLSVFEWLNSRVSTFLAVRDRQRTVEFVRLNREIREYVPDIAKATHNILTLANPGYELKVYRNNSIGTDAPTIDSIGQDICDDFANRMFGEYSGAFDVGKNTSKSHIGLKAFINMCHLVAFTQGAMAAEVQLTPGLDDIEDVYPVDPVYIDFKKDNQTLRWMSGVNTFYVGTKTKNRQNQEDGFYQLNPLLFKYVPYSPDVNQPAGRSPFSAILEVVFFQTQLYRDLQAIAHQTNMPRLDVKLVSEAVEQVIKTQRPDLAQVGHEADRQAFLDSYLNDLQLAVQNLEADDAFIHWDSVETDYISPKSAAFPIKDLLDAIDRSIISATLQLPVLLGRNEGATTTHATIQWSVYIQQISAFQKISEALVTWIFNLLLRVHGRNSSVSFEFTKHKTSDDFLDAQAENMRIQSMSTAVQKGWITNDEAANLLFEHNAAKEIDPNAQLNAPKDQSGLPGQPAAVVQDASQKAAQE